MPKRPRSPDDVFRQFKIHVSEKELNNGVLKESNMQRIYEKTRNLLYEGSNPKKRSAQEGLLNGIIDLKICLKCQADIGCDENNYQCEYCEKAFCYSCLRECKKCSNMYCTTCSVDECCDFKENCAVCLSCM